MSRELSSESRLIISKVERLDDRTRDKFLLAVLNLEHIRSTAKGAAFFRQLVAIIATISNMSHHSRGMTLARLELAVEKEEGWLAEHPASAAPSREIAHAMTARSQHRQRLSEGNRRRWARWRAERGIPEPRRAEENLIRIDFVAELARRSDT